MQPSRYLLNDSLNISLYNSLNNLLASVQYQHNLEFTVHLIYHLYPIQTKFVLHLQSVAAGIQQHIGYLVYKLFYTY